MKLRLVLLCVTIVSYGTQAILAETARTHGRAIRRLARWRAAGWKNLPCQDLPEVEYFDCELPRVRRMMLDPESFLDGLVGKRIVLDEIHRLQNPSELLKIAADHHSRTHMVANWFFDSGLRKKFRDTLAGRKRDLWLCADVPSRHGRTRTRRI